MKKILEEKINKEYKLNLNIKKTEIKSSNEGIVFLGYKFKIINNNKLIIKLSKKSKDNIKNKMKKNMYLYKNNKLSFDKFFTSVQTYQNSYIFVDKKITKRIVEKYF